MCPSTASRLRKIAPWPVTLTSGVSELKYAYLTSLRLRVKQTVHRPRCPNLHVLVGLTVVGEPELILLRESGLDGEGGEALMDLGLGGALVAGVAAVDLSPVLMSAWAQKSSGQVALNKLLEARCSRQAARGRVLYSTCSR